MSTFNIQTLNETGISGTFFTRVRMESNQLQVVMHLIPSGDIFTLIYTDFLQYVTATAN